MRRFLNYLAALYSLKTNTTIRISYLFHITKETKLVATYLRGFTLM
jgi:hypothetical protein